MAMTEKKHREATLLGIVSAGKRFPTHSSAFDLDNADVAVYVNVHVNGSVDQLSLISKTLFLKVSAHFIATSDWSLN
jgi:hypothetical protein